MLPLLQMANGVFRMINKFLKNSDNALLRLKTNGFIIIPALTRLP